MESVISRTKIITSNTIVTDTDFSGWLVINQGDALVSVNNNILAKGERLNFLDCVPPSIKWETPIEIIFPNGSGEVVLTQLIYK